MIKPFVHTAAAVRIVFGDGAAETRLSDEHGKTTGVDPAVLPRTVVYDPRLTLTLPIELSVANGLNALAQCAETLWSRRHDPIAALLPHSATLGCARRPAAAAQIVAALGSDEPPTARGVAAAIASFEQALGAPRSLRELGLEESQLPAAVARVTAVLGAPPWQIHRSRIDALLRDAWAGVPPRTLDKAAA